MRGYLALWLFLEVSAARARRRRHARAEQPTPHVCQFCDQPLPAAA
jgi:hypothetical protein